MPYHYLKGDGPKNVKQGAILDRVAYQGSWSSGSLRD